MALVSSRFEEWSLAEWTASKIFLWDDNDQWDVLVWNEMSQESNDHLIWLRLDNCWSVNPLFLSLSLSIFSFCLLLRFLLLLSFIFFLSFISFVFLFSFLHYYFFIFQFYSYPQIFFFLFRILNQFLLFKNFFKNFAFLKKRGRHYFFFFFW